jgi:ABC-type polysaccharide/polyol phosphate export permease
MIWIKPEMAKSAVEVIVTLLLTAIFAVLLSAAVSSMFRRTAAATATAYTLLVALCAGTMLVWLGRDAPFTQRTVEAVLQVNPLAAALAAIQAPGFSDYHLVPANWWIIGTASVVCLLTLIVRTWRLTRPQ